MVGCYRAITLFIVALCPTPVKPKFLVGIQHITAGYHNVHPAPYEAPHKKIREYISHKINIALGIKSHRKIVF
jgi:hypothetical protein